MRKPGKGILALLMVLTMTVLSGVIPVFAADNAEPEQTVAEVAVNEAVAFDVTGLETISEPTDEEVIPDSAEGSGGELEMTFEAQDPFDLQGMERTPTIRQRAYNAAGFTGEGSYLYGDQLASGSAARMVYDALSDAWLGEDPGNIQREVTVDFGDLAIPMHTTVSGVYNKKSNWDAQSVYNFELAIQCAIDAFLYDFPDIFWMKFGTGGMTYSIRYMAIDEFDFNITAVTVTASLIDNASEYYADVDDRISVLSGGFEAAGDNAGKIKRAHDYIAANIEYGYTSRFGDPHTRTPYGMLFGDYIVCEGYARTFKLFCDRFGVPCVLVMGRALPSNELHMWNAVQLDGKWYLVDVTWDDRGGSKVVDYYFLAGLDTAISGMSSSYNTPRKSHIPDGIINSSALSFTYPQLQAASYFGQTSPSMGSSTPSKSGSSGSSSGSGGGGGSGGAGGGAVGTFTAIVENKPMDVTPAAAYAAVGDAVKAAKESGAGTADLRIKNPGKITLDIFRGIVQAAGMPVRLIADAMSSDGKSVEVRISLDPYKAAADLNLAASVSGEKATKIKANFENWFKNGTQPVSLEQRTAFGQEVEFAVKLDKKLDEENLRLYVYDGKTCELLANQGYTVDQNGYVRFTADPAGDIIISAGILEKR